MNNRGFYIVVFLIITVVLPMPACDSTFSINLGTGDMMEYLITYRLDVGIELDTVQVVIPFDSTDGWGNYYFIQNAYSIFPIEPPIMLFPAQSHFMIDTLNRVYENLLGEFPTADDRLIYDLNANEGEFWIVQDYGAGYDVGMVTAEFDALLFGDTVCSKLITFYGTSDTSDTSIWLSQYSVIIADGFGLTWKGGGEGGGGEAFLTGAVIGGILYGDTTNLALKSIKVPLTQALLYPNYPNPFNPITTIPFDLPEPSKVTLIIYDLQGREVRTLVQGPVAAGFQQAKWDGKDNHSNPLPSGMYLYRLSVHTVTRDQTYTQTRKLVLLK